MGGAPVYLRGASEVLNQLLAQFSYTSYHVLCDMNTYEMCWPVIKNANWPSDPYVITVPPGEPEKNLNTCRRIWNALVDNKADRRSLFISLGGGVVTDMGGFCAATFMRGMDFAHVPTSLMGMTDAAIGGKQGVDYGKLKNYLGIFAEPEFVLVDPGFLKTLPHREIRNGLAEVLKHAFLSGSKLLEMIEAQGNSLNGEDMQAAIRESILVKKKFVDSDEREQNIRAALNFGHTIGHAIETRMLGTAQSLLHGEAIGLGMACETMISTRMTGLSEESARRINRTIKSYFPDIRMPDVPFEDILELIQKDKKRRGNDVQFALLRDLGDPVTQVTVPEQTIRDAWSELGRDLAE